METCGSGERSGYGVAWAGCHGAVALREGLEVETEMDMDMEWEDVVQVDGSGQPCSQSESC